MRALAAWREHDIARAIHPADRAAITSTESARTLVLELLAGPVVAARAEPQRDLFNACAALGRLLADAGASPTLAALTMDGAAGAIGSVDPARLAAARASLIEAYTAARLEAERALARRAWDYPACAARLDRETVAIAAGHPEADREVLADWAARVALAASKDGVKVAVVSGADLAREELASALDLVGIAVRADLARTPGRGAGWLKLPWRK